MRASVAGRRFESESWNGLVSLAVASAGRRESTPQERIDAAEELSKGNDALVAGIRIHPEN